MKSIYFAPLQSYTNAAYRNLHNKYFGGIDKYFAPYLRFEPNKELKKSVVKDLLPENNKNIKLVPQLLGKDVALFIEHSKKLEQDGYKEINWNLACPFPMVYKSGFGSGLLKTPEIINDILEQVLPKINLPLSIKCRLGFDDEKDIFKIIEILNKFDLEEVIVHTRTAKQMYKGEANFNIFSDILEQSKNKLIYNGDIINIESLGKINTNNIMIGRGLLQNPLLANEINGKFIEQDDKRKILKDFYDELYFSYEQQLEKSHILIKMQKHWEYFSYVFENRKKVYKMTKKTSSLKKFNERVLEIFQLEALLTLQILNHILFIIG